MDDEPNNEEEPEVIKTQEEIFKEAAELLNQTARSFLQAFVFLEETVQQAAEVCVDLAKLLKEDDSTNPEGDTSVE